MKREKEAAFMSVGAMLIQDLTTKVENRVRGTASKLLQEDLRK